MNYRARKQTVAEERRCVLLALPLSSCPGNKVVFLFLFFSLFIFLSEPSSEDRLGARIMAAFGQELVQVRTPPSCLVSELLCQLIACLLMHLCIALSSDCLRACADSCDRQRHPSKERTVHN